MSPASSASWTPLQLVAERLEPELVDLVDDDEQQLVVLGSVGTGRALELERQQLRDLEIRGVGDGAAGHRPMVRRVSPRPRGGRPANRPGSVARLDAHDEQRRLIIADHLRVVGHGAAASSSRVHHCEIVRAPATPPDTGRRRHRRCRRGHDAR